MSDPPLRCPLNEKDTGALLTLFQATAPPGGQYVPNGVSCGMWLARLTGAGSVLPGPQPCTPPPLLPNDGIPPTPLQPASDPKSGWDPRSQEGVGGPRSDQKERSILGMGRVSVCWTADDSCA